MTATPIPAAAPNYLVVVPDYRDTSGGIMFLHKLADELCQLGESALIWPLGFTKGQPDWWAGAQTGFKMLPGTASRLARPEDLHADSIVIYPEIVHGNPLGARNVVRWLMFPPSLRGTADSFGPKDLYFKVSDFSDDRRLSGGAQLLQLFSIHPAYSDRGNPDRRGTCYMLRKQGNKQWLHDPAKDIGLDGLGHEEIAHHFNTCERFICYDEATMYAQFAALCGCLSIVVPGIYRDRATWSGQRPIAKYGVAFGLEDTAHAIGTRHLLGNHLRQLEAEGKETVLRFVERTKREFG